MTRRRGAPKKNGRPVEPVKLTPEQMVEVLASRLVPTADIATELGIARSTLYAKFSDAIEKGHARARNGIREAQFNVGVGGNAVMLIWLGKQYLGQTDKLDLSKLSDDELRRLLAAATSGAARTPAETDREDGGADTN